MLKRKTYRMLKFVCSNFGFVLQRKPNVIKSIQKTVAGKFVDLEVS